MLSRLPPSLAMQLMDAERERQRAANRAALEARAAAPANFSQFQMQQYLAATRFRWVLPPQGGGVSKAGGRGARSRWVALHTSSTRLPSPRV